MLICYKTPSVMRYACMDTQIRSAVAAGGSDGCVFDVRGATAAAVAGAEYGLDLLSAASAMLDEEHPDSDALLEAALGMNQAPMRAWSVENDLAQLKAASKKDEVLMADRLLDGLTYGIINAVTPEIALEDFMTVSLLAAQYSWQ